ncbi:ADP-ribose pyrophosphatase [Pseudoalteromonas phenolica]|uniref:ADP-ribose pyrophosphatase n=1 Tax=Pseudoalteromonas phenolica TaxID=161398 RepID=A0A4V2EK96_9GAMM|nr:NUDIX hydrolase [Pseudoalteromonas phenolica]RZQ55078.1 ADP-ribose pyrophosphatase [Pseudoalteromonas phenolica]TMN87574.1 ADP-ribose pyrophosphatase [Pseudoalteromonas phenolica]
MSELVRVGVAVVIIRDGKILLGERIGSHGANTWATPGGHLEMGEEIEACAIRETLEETGLEVSEVSPLGFSNDVFNPLNKHYVTLYLVASGVEGEPEIMEPNKCLAWQWFGLDELPEPLFLSLENFLKQDKLQTLIDKR